MEIIMMLSILVVVIGIVVINKRLKTKNSTITKGSSSTIDKSSPVSVIGSVGNIAELKVNESIWTWGNNGNRQLKDNTAVNKSSPVSIVGGDSSVRIITEQNNISVFTTLGVILGLSFIVAGINWCNPKQETKEDVQNDIKYHAWTLSEKIVKRHLKCPSTASFPDIDYKQEVMSMPDNDNPGSTLYGLNGCVDAQNSFGAMIRSRYIVVIRHTPPSNYSIEKCSIDNVMCIDTELAKNLPQEIRINKQHIKKSMNYQKRQETIRKETKEITQKLRQKFYEKEKADNNR